MKNTRAANIILVIVVLLTLILGVLVLCNPPSFFPDPSHGFQVMRSMQMGGPFNTFISPDQDDISKNTSLYLTWWSPGQYLVPMFFQSVFGMDTGHATALAIIIFELSGLLGFYYFFQQIGFTRMVTALSIVFIICQQAFILPFVFYNGGEVLLFGFEGWFLYGCVAIDKPGLKMLLFILLSGWLGFLFKSSFIWIYAAGLMCMWLKMSSIAAKPNMQKLLKNGIWTAVPAVISLMCIYIFFLSKGVNPASGASGVKISWENFTFPIGSPLLSGFSVDDLARGLLFHPVGSLLSPIMALVVLALSAIISLGLIWAIMRYVPKNNYRLLLIVFYTVSVLFFTLAFMRQSSISYESRHFRIIGLLIIPGVIYLFSRFKPIFKGLLVVVCVAIATVNYAFLIKCYTFNKNISAHGNSGMAQEYIDQPSLNYIMQLDRQSHNAIFAFISSDLGLEIKNNRVITLDVPPSVVSVNYDDYSYDGHAGPLYLVLSAGYNAAIDTMFTKFFPGYSNFTEKKLSKDYVLFEAK
jgi:hypothetical protein